MLDDYDPNEKSSIKTLHIQPASEKDIEKDKQLQLIKEENEWEEVEEEVTDESTAEEKTDDEGAGNLPRKKPFSKYTINDQDDADKLLAGSPSEIQMPKRHAALAPLTRPPIPNQSHQNSISNLMDDSSSKTDSPLAAPVPVKDLTKLESFHSLSEQPKKKFRKVRRKRPAPLSALAMARGASPVTPNSGLTPSPVPVSPDLATASLDLTSQKKEIPTPITEYRPSLASRLDVPQYADNRGSVIVAISSNDSHSGKLLSQTRIEGRRAAMSAFCNMLSNGHQTSFHEQILELSCNPHRPVWLVDAVFLADCCSLGAHIFVGYSRFDRLR